MARPKSIPFVPEAGERYLLQLMVTLKDSDPKIWRRLLVASEMPVEDLHVALQFSFGWDNSHMHHFYKVINRERVYYEPELEAFFDSYFDDWGPKQIKYSKLKVADILISPKDKLMYEYDFGDSWLHEIVVEKLLPMEDDFVTPRCLAGELAGPPEDCGGIFGYYDMLNTLKNGKKDDKEDLLEWLGEEFDPEEFYLDHVNHMLSKITPPKPKKARAAKAKETNTEDPSTSTKKQSATKKTTASKK